MSENRPISEYSRQELYELLWSTPASKLAAVFGISNVAIAKRCKGLNVPRPSRGYWAKVAAGRAPRKVPMPPTTDEMFKQSARRRIRKSLSLPATTESLVPLASELMNAIVKAKPDSHKRTHLRQVTLPEVTVSKTLAERVALAFHTILTSLEPLSIIFRKSRSSYNGGHFERKKERLYLCIVEDLVGQDGSRHTAPYWQSLHGKETVSGYLTFSLNPSRYGTQAVKAWSESPKLPLERVLAQVVATICDHFVEVQERREREAIQRAKEHAEWLQHRQEWERKEAIRLQQESTRKHAEELAAVVQARKAALLKAAENWRSGLTMLDFIGTCELHWKNDSGALTAAQTNWLTWAREIAAAISPFSVGYPDPANDGPFDPGSVPLGDPTQWSGRLGDR